MFLSSRVTPALDSLLIDGHPLADPCLDHDPSILRLRMSLANSAARKDANMRAVFVEAPELASLAVPAEISERPSNNCVMVLFATRDILPNEQLTWYYPLWINAVTPPAPRTSDTSNRSSTAAQKPQVATAPTPAPAPEPTPAASAPAPAPVAALAVPVTELNPSDFFDMIARERDSADGMRFRHSSGPSNETELLAMIARERDVPSGSGASAALGVLDPPASAHPITISSDDDMADSSAGLPAQLLHDVAFGDAIRQSRIAMTPRPYSLLDRHNEIHAIRESRIASISTSRQQLIDDGTITIPRLSAIQASQFPDCAICLNGFEEGQSVRMPKCFHHFHEECLSNAYQHDPNLACPVCRVRLRDLVTRLANQTGLDDQVAAVGRVGDFNETVADDSPESPPHQAPEPALANDPNLHQSSAVSTSTERDPLAEASMPQQSSGTPFPEREPPAEAPMLEHEYADQRPPGWTSSNDSLAIAEIQGRGRGTRGRGRGRGGNSGRGRGRGAILLTEPPMPSLSATQQPPLSMGIDPSLQTPRASRQTSNDDGDLSSDSSSSSSSCHDHAIPRRRAPKFLPGPAESDAILHRLCQDVPYTHSRNGQKPCWQRHLQGLKSIGLCQSLSVRAYKTLAKWANDKCKKRIAFRAREKRQSGLATIEPPQIIDCLSGPHPKPYSCNT